MVRLRWRQASQRKAGFLGRFATGSGSSGRGISTIASGVVDTSKLAFSTGTKPTDS